MNSTINRAHQHSTTVSRDTGTVERGFFTIGSRAIHPVRGPSTAMIGRIPVTKMESKGRGFRRLLIRIEDAE